MAELVLAIDAMGGDNAPAIVIDGLSMVAARRSDLNFILHGRETELAPLVSDKQLSARCQIVHHDDVVAMSAKPSAALRKAKTTSMWGALQSVKSGEAAASVSAGNTGALMAFSMLALRKMEGVHRPAMTAVWPSMSGSTVVLDVGANLEANAEQLVIFAIMGEAYARAVTGVEKPKIGLLNVGSEEGKGPDSLKLAADLLRDPALELNFVGYVEGNDIAMGTADVVVTDGFTGNVALKTAEGTARLAARYVKDALTSSPMSKVGALLASTGLNKLKDQMNPSKVNGGVLLGLNGVSVKSHGGTDAVGYATAVDLAADLASSHYMEEVATGLTRAKPEATLSEAAE